MYPERTPIRIAETSAEANALMENNKNIYFIIIEY